MSSFEMLDESKPFDLIYASKKGIKYHQEGKYFNGRKQRVNLDGEYVMSSEATKTAPITSAEAIVATPRSDTPVDTGRASNGTFKSNAQRGKGRQAK